MKKIILEVKVLDFKTYKKEIKIGYIEDTYSDGTPNIKPCTWDEEGRCTLGTYGDLDD